MEEKLGPGCTAIQSGAVLRHFQSGGKRWQLLMDQGRELWLVGDGTAKVLLQMVAGNLKKGSLNDTLTYYRKSFD